MSQERLGWWIKGIAVRGMGLGCRVMDGFEVLFQLGERLAPSPPPKPGMPDRVMARIRAERTVLVADMEDIEWRDNNV